MRLGLCGRGPGFTPAGDDFIGGFLAIINWIRTNLKIGPRIIPGPEYRKLTTWTSFKLMECNARGLVDIEYDWRAQEKPGEKPSQSRLDDLEWQKMKTRGQISYHEYLAPLAFILRVVDDSISKIVSNQKVLTE